MHGGRVDFTTVTVYKSGDCASKTWLADWQPTEQGLRMDVVTDTADLDFIATVPMVNPANDPRIWTSPIPCWTQIMTTIGKCHTAHTGPTAHPVPTSRDPVAASLSGTPASPPPPCRK